MTAKDEKEKRRMYHPSIVTNQPSSKGTLGHVNQKEEKEKESVQSIRRLPNNTERPHWYATIVGLRQNESD